jgi:nitrogenase molybdenum-iron protein alpha chain
MTLHSTFSGNSEYEEFASAHTADLNVVMCHRSINYMAEMMEKRYGIPWFKISFIGAQATAKSLRKIAAYFGSPELTERVEKVIVEEMYYVEEVRQEVKERCEGKLAMLFVGGSRAHHYQDLFTEIGMKTVSAGYEFAHRDDYEGRNVLPSIVVDADSRNIEELKVVPDPEHFRPRVSDERQAQLKAEGVNLKDYPCMMRDMPSGSLALDEPSHHEIFKLLAIYKPDILGAGIKEKYAVQKFGVPCLQLHSYDYGGPFAGFAGAINFYKEIDRLVNSHVWSYLKAPWQQQTEIPVTFGRS